MKNLIKIVKADPGWGKVSVWYNSEDDVYVHRDIIIAWAIEIGTDDPQGHGLYTSATPVTIEYGHEHDGEAFFAISDPSGRYTLVGDRIFENAIEFSKHVDEMRAKYLPINTK